MDSAWYIEFDYKVISHWKISLNVRTKPRLVHSKLHVSSSLDPFGFFDYPIEGDMLHIDL